MVRSHQITIFGCLPSGKHAKNELENHRAITGKTHYFDWAMFNSYHKSAINPMEITIFLWINPTKSPFFIGKSSENHHENPPMTSPSISAKELRPPNAVATPARLSLAH